MEGCRASVTCHISLTTEVVVTAVTSVLSSAAADDASSLSSCGSELQAVKSPLRFAAPASAVQDGVAERALFAFRHSLQ
jgi:hypothetical protein